MNNAILLFSYRITKSFGEYLRMNKLTMLLAAIIILFLMPACAGTTESGAGGTAASEPQNQDSSADLEADSSESGKTRLTQDYPGALSTETQLALGTLKLEQTDLAVNEQSASELLPLWQAMQSLRNSDMAAEQEIIAVINQIQDMMDADQVSSIAEMKLTEESMTAMIESGEIALGRGNPAGARGDGEGSFPGGGPGGGLLGGGPGSREGGPGGLPGGGRADLSEDDIATRQAQFAEGGLGQVQDRMLANSVIRLLQTKTGEASERTAVFDTVFTVVSDETGLSADDIREKMSEGQSLAGIIENNGGEIDSIRELLIDALNELPNSEERDLERFVDDWLAP